MLLLKFHKFWAEKEVLHVSTEQHHPNTNKYRTVSVLTLPSLLDNRV